MAQVIGIIGDAVGLYDMISNFFAQPSDWHAKIRIAAALNGGEGPSGGEGSAKVRVYNNNHEILGGTGDAFVNSGGFHDYTVDMVANQQSVYLAVYATNDALCIPYITTTFSDGSNVGWVGDWGHECGLNWYYSNVWIENGKTKPKCTWIDADHTNGIEAGTIAIHFPSFHNNGGYSQDKQSYCGWPSFRAYSTNQGTQPIFEKRSENSHSVWNSTDDIDGDLGERRTKRAADRRLVISSAVEHSASELCSSETSFGPDFVSHTEGLYCNMETRQLLNICTEKLSTDCFQLPGNSSTGLIKRDGPTIQKKYKDVISWD